VLSACKPQGDPGAVQHTCSCNAVEHRRRCCALPLHAPSLHGLWCRARWLHVVPAVPRPAVATQHPNRPHPAGLPPASRLRQLYAASVVCRQLYAASMVRHQSHAASVVHRQSYAASVVHCACLACAAAPAGRPKPCRPRSRPFRRS